MASTNAGTIVMMPGIMRPASSITNAIRLPGNSKRANAYAIIDERSSTMNVVERATYNELPKYAAKLLSVHASR